MNVTNVKNYHKLECTRVGFEFEFYSNYKPEATAKKISKVLNKEIKFIDKYHSEEPVTDKCFKIEPDYSGGKGLLELITGPLDYNEARIIFTKMLKWIQKNGYTTDKASIHLNVSFKSDKTSSNFLTGMNILKFCIDFDEEFIYSRFPKRENSIYAKSIKDIYPINNSYDYNRSEVLPTLFHIPNTKYFGVNFTKLKKNYLEFRYVGGENYQDKTTEILDIMDQFIIQLYDNASDNKIPNSYTTKLKKILKKYDPIVDGCANLESFKRIFPKIDLTVDLQNNDKIVKTKFLTFKDRLFNLMLETGLKEGKLNYDSDTSRFQIQSAKISNCFNLDNTDLVKCDLVGIFNKCDIIDCKVNDSEMNDCNIRNSKVNASKINNSLVDRKTVADFCYIYGLNGIFNGKMKKCIFREGSIMHDATISEDSEIIDKLKMG